MTDTPEPTDQTEHIHDPATGNFYDPTQPKLEQIRGLIREAVRSREWREWLKDEVGYQMTEVERERELQQQIAALHHQSNPDDAAILREERMNDVGGERQGQDLRDLPEFAAGEEVGPHAAGEVHRLAAQQAYKNLRPPVRGRDRGEHPGEPLPVKSSIEGAMGVLYQNIVNAESRLAMLDERLVPVMNLMPPLKGEHSTIGHSPAGSKVFQQIMEAADRVLRLADRIEALEDALEV